MTKKAAIDYQRGDRVKVLCPRYLDKPEERILTIGGMHISGGVVLHDPANPNNGKIVVKPHIELESAEEGVRSE